MYYSEEFKESVVQKVLLSGRTQKSVVEETGVARSTLYKWLRVYAPSENSMPIKKELSPHQWPPGKRLDALVETASLDDTALGAWCRQHGLHTHHLIQWKQDVLEGTWGQNKSSAQKSLKKHKDEIKGLKQELRRKEKALAETAAVLVLKKKVATLWGDSEDD